MAAYLGYTLRMKTLFRGWPVMAHETHTRRRINSQLFAANRDLCLPTCIWCYHYGGGSLSELLWRLVWKS